MTQRNVTASQLDNSGRDAFFLRVIRPKNRWSVFGIHFPFVLIIGGAWLAVRYFADFPILFRPCTFDQWTGYPCIFCGYTRAFAALSRGQWSVAWLNNPLAVILYIAALIVFLWNAVALIIGCHLYPGRFFRHIKARWIAIILAVLFILNWGYRLFYAL